MNRSHLVLAITIMGAVGSWVITLPSWHAALTTANVGALILAVVSVVGAAIGVNKSDLVNNKTN